MRIVNIEPREILSKPAMFTGLGDVIHAVANPAAKVLDKVFGTDLKNCGGCSKRRNNLNKKFPL